MSENAVAEPLSGSEIIEAIVFKVRDQLRRDCFLSPNSAYEYFSGKIFIEVTAVDCGRQATVTTKIEHTAGTLDPEADVHVEESNENIERDPPNVVRRETEQPVPVVTEDPSGKVEQRRVKYQRQEKAQPPRDGTKAQHRGGGPPPAA